VTTASYPQPRYDRGSSSGPASATPERGSTIPGVKIWPFVLDTGAGGGSIAVSGQYQGMAVVTDLEFEIIASNTTSVTNLELYAAIDGGGRSEGGAGTTRPTGSPLFEFNDYVSAGDANNTGGQSLAFIGAKAAGPVHRVPLRVPITLSQFFLKAYAHSTGGVSTTINGFVRVVTGLFEDEVPNFL